jgi:hypothetical protein
LFTLCDHVDKVLDKHERHPFSLDAEFLLEMAQKVSEIDVKKLSLLVDHYIVRVPITDAQNECSYTKSSAGLCKIINSSLKSGK